MTSRIREVLGEVDRPCRACGSGCVVAIETRSAQGFWSRVLVGRDRRVTRYDTCLDCRTTVRVGSVRPGRISGGDTLGPGYVAL